MGGGRRRRWVLRFVVECAAVGIISRSSEFPSIDLPVDGWIDVRK